MNPFTITALFLITCSYCLTATSTTLHEKFTSLGISIVAVILAIIGYFVEKKK